MISSIVIVGGGSTGWMTAAYLSRVLKNVSITLIEDPAVPTIGVGESTNQITERFNGLLGLDERDFLRHVNGAYKVAIRFDGFSRLGHSFQHPFGVASVPRERVYGKPLAERYYRTDHLARHSKFDKETPAGFGYQLDASLYGDFLKRYATANGVRHRTGHVDDVEMSDGNITSVLGVRGDLFIDCSGFRSILLGTQLQVPFAPLTSRLFNDRAIAMSVPYADKPAELEACTRCTALSAGWVWNIPLWNRIGSGYVYSSKFISDDEAEAEYRGHLGSRRGNDQPCRRIKIRNGRHASAWVGNCVALGLAFGFIEPLESTGLALTQQSIMDLGTMILAWERERFNERTTSLFDSTVDFIVAHYALSDRDDTPYWRAIRDSRTQLETPAYSQVLSLAAERQLPAINDDDHFYHSGSWNLILAGMGFYGSGDGSRPEEIDVSDAPSHYEYLRSNVHS